MFLKPYLKTNKFSVAPLYKYLWHFIAGDGNPTLPLSPTLENFRLRISRKGLPSAGKSMNHYDYSFRKQWFSLRCFEYDPRAMQRPWTLVHLILSHRHCIRQCNIICKKHYLDPFLPKHLLTPCRTPFILSDTTCLSLMSHHLEQHNSSACHKQPTSLRSAAPIPWSP